MRRLASWLVLCLCACERAPAPSPAAPTKGNSSFALRAVFQPEIDRLALPAAKLAALDAETSERLRGIVAEAAHTQGKAHALALRDGAAIGAAAVPFLEARVDDPAGDERERLAAFEVLGAIDAPESAEALAKRIDLQIAREPWVRAQAAYQLTFQSSDHWLPRVLAQLKYETDGATVIWIAAALARHANYAGVDGLRVLSTTGKDERVRADAAATWERLAHEASFASPDALLAAWFGDDPGGLLPRREPSARLRLEMWRCIARLGEFDLRLVDDARFALSRSSDWIVPVLVGALHERNDHVRLHVVQCLERMGARARGACSDLALALDEPHIAANAASALGEIGCLDALTALIACTSPGRALELRGAAAAALARVARDDRPAAPETLGALRRLLDAAEPVDLRQAAAQALLSLDGDLVAAAFVIECMTSTSADGAAAETALQSWLEQRATSQATGAADDLRAWRELPSAQIEAPTLEQVRVRLRERSTIARRIVERR